MVDTLTNLSIPSLIALITAVFALVTGAAYMTGILDPYIKKAEYYFLKLEAGAEAKKLQAQGMKEGEDFIAGDLKGNQQAEDVKKGLGGIGGGLGGGLKDAGGKEGFGGLKVGL